LYAVDVDRDATSEDEILIEAWYYPYNGISQASRFCKFSGDISDLFLSVTNRVIQPLIYPLRYLM
jgi:hypothetical protein